MTTTQDREIGPRRFQRQQTTNQAPGSKMRAFGAFLVLAVLLAGVPAAAVAFDAVPAVPTSLPTRDDLTSAIGAEELVSVLLWVAALAWLQFTVCVLVEMRSAMRGIGLPSRVPLSGPSQKFARALVASVIVAMSAAGTATAATPTPSAAPAAPETSASQVVDEAGQQAGRDGGGNKGGGAQTQRQHQQAADADGDVTFYLGDEVIADEDAKSLVGKKVYRVQPPDGRYHDNLWDIAERHLGDGRRYQEIYELNKGRDQPDGHELSLARLIYPNWLLIMPDDAKGAERVTAVENEPSGGGAGQGGQSGGSGQDKPAEDGSKQESGDSGAGGSEQKEQSGQGEGSGRAAEENPATGVAMISDFAEDFVHEPGALVGTGLLAAGLLGSIEAVRRRRRTPEPSADDVEVEVALRIGADPGRAAWLDKSLRLLAAACEQQGMPLPAAYAARVDDDSVDLLIAPAVPSAPAPWTALDDGRQWHIDRAAAGAAQLAPSDTAPYPGLVSLGRDADERDVLIDLEAATGPICVIGDPGASYEVVTALAAELATNWWSDHLQVTGSGLPEEMALIEGDRYREVNDLAAVISELEARQAGRVGGDVLTGRVRSGGSEVWSPEYVALGTVPSEAVAADFARLTSSSARLPLGVLCAGDLPGARWRLSVDAAGNLEVPILGLSVRANRLSRAGVAAVAAMVEPEAAAGVGDGVPGETLPEAWLPEARPYVPLPGASVDESALATAPVRVFVLGPAEVQCDGTIDEGRLDIATEIVVYLALHPEGVHPTVLSGAIWPKGVTATVRDQTIERVREWLGTNPEGSPYLQLTGDDRLRLSDDVVLDWDVVKLLLNRARETSKPSEEADLLRRALRVARGEVLSSRPRGRYAWIARARLERSASDLLVDAAHRLGVLCVEAGEHAMSVAAARAGLRVRPAEQLLWRDLLVAENARVGHEGVQAVVDELTTTLRSLGVTDLDAETMALLDDLLPQGQTHAPGQVHAASGA